MIGVVAIAAFVSGAAWLKLRLWPYQLIAETEYFKSVGGQSSKPKAQIRSRFVDLKLDYFNVADRLPIEPFGGGIHAFDDKILIMSYRGQFYLYQRSNGEVSIDRLEIDLDNSYDLFQEYATRNDLDIDKAAKYFRFVDIIYDRDSTPPALLVTHHQWHKQRGCFTLRLSKLDLSPNQPLATASASTDDWRKVYDTTPCLDVIAEGRVFAGERSGGRLELLDSDSVLLTVGGHALEGKSGGRIHAQDESSDLGKVIQVDLNSGAATHVSVGNRNPQGLLVDDEGNIWSTEHGPQGGDELNIILQDENYGWPFVTYGSEYGFRPWPFSVAQNRHDGYARPIYAWVPSIGVSNLIQVKRFAPEWDGDLLVSSLKQNTLHRLRYKDGRIIFDEPINVRSRIRDIDQLMDGTIVLWTDDASIIEMRRVESAMPKVDNVVTSLQGPKRQQALDTIETCQRCHDDAPGGEAENAPNLWGVFGREIAGTDFKRYSSGLKDKDGIWNEETLDSYLKDVQGFSAGSTMAFAGVSDDDVRAATIEYLKSLQ